MKCPYCDYEGDEPAVKAHISGKTDPPHKGKAGWVLDQEDVEAEESRGLGSVAFDREGENGVPVSWLLAGTAVVAVAVVVILAARRSSSSSGAPGSSGKTPKRPTSQNEEQQGVTA